jgi:hypothetical protein
LLVAALPKEGVNLVHLTGHGLHRGVGQMCVHRPPEPLHQMVVGAGVRAKDEPDLGMLPSQLGSGSAGS